MHDDTDIGGPDGRFPQTRMTAVAGARSDDPREREAALHILMAAYWKPVYKYLRIRWRKDNEDAKDLTQEFFTRLMAKDFLAAYDPEKARLRTYLRVCVDRLVQNEQRAEARQKRGGGVLLESLDFSSAEGELAKRESLASDSPHDLFEREWIRALFSASVDALERDCDQSGRAIDFEIFRRYDLAEDPDSRPTYAELAAELELSTASVTNRLAAARRRFRHAVLATLRATVADEAEFRREAVSLFGREATD